jgi:hypothetical protein
MGVEGLMDIATKLRILDRIGEIFPAWAIERQARIIERAFDSELAKAKSEEERQEVNQRRRFEASEYWDELAQFRSRRLISQTRKLYVPLENLVWETGDFGHRYLEDESEARIYRALREEKQKLCDFRIKMLVALTGLIGTLIGLVSLFGRGRRKGNCRR